LTSLRIGSGRRVGADLRVGPPDGWTHRPTPTELCELCGEYFFTGNLDGFVEARFVNELESSGFFEEMNRQYGK